MRKFSKIIFDLDGVIYRGHTPIKGVAQSIQRLKSSGLSVFYLTNNATRSRAHLVRRLRKMGIVVKPNEIMTSAYATAYYLTQMRPKPQSLYVIGEAGLRDELRAAGFSILPFKLRGEIESATTFSPLPQGEVQPGAHILVTGLDRQVTYAKLAAGLDVLHAGAKWVACNLDPTLPMEHGAHPGSGALGVSLAYAAGTVKSGARAAGSAFSNIILREPDAVVGKPGTYMADLLCGKNKSASSRKNILFVGDRLDMDIAFANSAGLSSLLVLTGVAKKKEAQIARGLLKPHFILPSVAQMPKWLGL